MVIFRFVCSGLDDVDDVAGALGERRLVGRLDAGLAQRDRVPQHLDAESLRRLRQENHFAGNRLDNLHGALHAPDALHGVAHRLRRDRRAVFSRGANGPADQIARHQRTRRVVNEHDLGAADRWP